MIEFSRIRLASNFALLTALVGCEWTVGPTDTRGYEIEELPLLVAASYARGDDVYLGLQDGRIVRVDDSDLSKPWSDLGNPFGFGPRLLFVAYVHSSDRREVRLDAAADVQ